MQSVALYIMARKVQKVCMKYSLFSKLLLKNNGANTKAFLNHCKGRKSIKASFIGCKGTKIFKYQLLILKYFVPLYSILIETDVRLHT